MDLKTRQLYFNRCDPYEALNPADERNLDLDNGNDPVRGVNWVERLAVRIELSQRPTYGLFTGLPGSGKSTELRRLKTYLERPDGAHKLVVLVDAEEVLDLTNPLDVPDLLAAVIYKTELALALAEGNEGEKALQTGPMARLWDWIRAKDVELSKAEFSLQIFKLVFEIKDRPNLRARVRKVVGAHLPEFLRQVSEEIRAMDERARKLGYGGLVIIVDSLEKLRGISSNWTEVLESAERMFANRGPHLTLPVHVIYTIPTALVARRIDEVEFMPMVKLRTQSGDVWQPGIESARQLTRARIPDEILAEILGPDYERRCRGLISWSGGFPREIIRMLRALIAVGRYPVSDKDFSRIGNEIYDQFNLIITSNAYPWLARVSLSKNLSITDEDHRPMVDQLLSNNAVLRYLNDEGWFDLHPAIERIPELQLAKAALIKADATQAQEN